MPAKIGSLGSRVLKREGAVPTYEYVCTECGQDLEVVQSFSDAALTECPQCSGKLRKRFSPVGVVFKGSGFYKTDSRQKPRKSADEPAKPAAAVSGDGKPAGIPAQSGAGADTGGDGPAKRPGGGERAAQKADVPAGPPKSDSRSGAGKGSGKPSSSAA